MRVPVSWLREYVSFDMPPRELGELLSMTGTKLEAVHRIGVPAGAELFKVGRVISSEQHPDADRLSLCTVDVGDGEPRQIVCGATNFDAGATVGVALPGATLPDGTVLRVAKLRGVESHGMMLSESELELSGDHDGLMLLDDGLVPGTPLSQVLPIDDEVLEFEITSNRPDCLSVYGIAREASASLDADLAPWPGREPEASGDDSVDSWVTARIDAPDLCPRWAARVFTDVKVGPSPPWLKARVAAAGMRPISNVVDITNYVMLCVGEPTHAFDLDKVTGREIIVRRAGDGERVITLDGQERTLDADVLVIADAEKPSAVGGLMGSQWSEVSDATTTVLMECANFDGPNIQSSSTRLELRTEGSTRWEKGLDPHLVPRALALASQLMVELTGARLVPGTVDLHGQLPEPAVVPLRRERLELLIGVPYEQAQIDRALTRLGYESADGGWRVPTWRANDTVPRGRPDRGGVTHRRRLEGADGDAAARRRDRQARPRRAAAQPRDRRAAGRRPVGGGHRRVHRRDAGRPAAACARPSSPRRGAGGEPDGCRPGAASHGAVPGAAGLCPPQPGCRPRPGRPVRGGPCGAAGAR